MIWLYICILLLIIVVLFNILIILRIHDPSYRAAIEHFMEKGIRRGLPKIKVCSIIYCMIVMDIFEDLRDRFSPSNHRL